MWVGAIKLRVHTKDASYAGTDSLVTATIVRDGVAISKLRLDYTSEDDLERDATRDYVYYNLKRSNDQTPELPPGVGQTPMPYPDHGIEFSHKLPGHFKLRVEIHGSDMWIKDNVDVYVKEIRQEATSFDTLAWVEDESWSYVGTWSRDIALSKDSDEGVRVLNLVLN